MAYLNKKHPMSKLAHEILAINHCVALHDVVAEADFFFITFEKGGKQYKMVLDGDIYVSLYDLRNNIIMPRTRYRLDVKRIAYDILQYIVI